MSIAHGEDIDWSSPEIGPRSTPVLNLHHASRHTDIYLRDTVPPIRGRHAALHGHQITVAIRPREALRLRGRSDELTHCQQPPAEPFKDGSACHRHSPANCKTRPNRWHRGLRLDCTVRRKAARSWSDPRQLPVARRPRHGCSSRFQLPSACTTTHTSIDHT